MTQVREPSLDEYWTATPLAVSGWPSFGVCFDHLIVLPSTYYALDLRFVFLIFLARFCHRWQQNNPFGCGASDLSLDGALHLTLIFIPSIIYNFYLRGCALHTRMLTLWWPTMPRIIHFEISTAKLKPLPPISIRNQKARDRLRK